MIIRLSESLSSKVSPFACNIVLIGTITIPVLAAAQYIKTNSSRLVIIVATLSPLEIPLSNRALDRRLARQFSSLNVYSESPIAIAGLSGL